MIARKRLWPFLLALAPLQARGVEKADLSYAADLAFGVRVHRSEIVLGDPVYLELEIVNRGKHVVRAAPFGFSNLLFRASDPETGLETECLVGSAARTYGDVAPRIVSYLPDEPRRGFFRIFVPKIQQLRHPFWTEAVKHGKVQIGCHFVLRPNLHLISARASLQIRARPEDELQALERWSQRPLDTTRKLDARVLFGTARLLGVRSRQDTNDFATVVKTGEFGELAQYVLRMQAVEFSENRDAASQSLVEWVRKQPEIKREWLAQEIQSHRVLLTESAVTTFKEIAKGTSDIPSK